MNIIANAPDTGVRIVMAEISAPSLEGFTYIPKEGVTWYVNRETGTYLRSRHIAGRRVWWRGYVLLEEGRV